MKLCNIYCISHVPMNCKECISYAMCRTNLISSLRESKHKFGKSWNVWTSFWDMTHNIGCLDPKNKLTNMFMEKHGTPHEKRLVVMNGIMETFDIDYDKLIGV